MTALDYLLHSLEEVDAESFYSDVFRLGTGSLQIENEPPGQGKTNPIIIGSIHGKMKRRILFEDTFFDTLHSILMIFLSSVAVAIGVRKTRRIVKISFMR